MEIILKQILQGINEIKTEVASIKEQHRTDFQKIDTRLKAMNQRLDSFKFDTDYIVKSK